MTVDAHAMVHPDPRLFLSDLALWEKDVAAWQQELSAATAELDRAAEAAEDRRKALECPYTLSGGALLTPHLAVLERHNEALERHGDRLRGEPEFLAEYGAATGGGEPGEAPPATLRPGAALADRIARHPRLWDAHVRLGQHHRAVMETTTRLLRAVAAPS